MFLNGTTSISGSLFGTSSLFDYFDTRYTAPVKIIFYGNIIAPVVFIAAVAIFIILRLVKKKAPVSALAAALFVVSIPIIYFSISIPGISSKYYIPLDNSLRNIYLVFAGFFLVFAICCFFYFVSDGLRLIKEKSTKLRYSKDNLFLFGQITSKLRTTSKTMAIICITLVVSIVLTVLAPVFSNWIMGYLDARAPYDIQVFSAYNTVYEPEDLKKADYDFVTKEILNENTPISQSHAFYSYFLKEDDFYNRIVYEFPALALSLTDYNRLRSMAGLTDINLSDNEYTTQWYTTATDDEISDYLAQYAEVEVSGEVIIPSSTPSYKDNLGEYIYNNYTVVLFILPDWACEGLMAANYYFIANTDTAMSYQDAIVLQDSISGYAGDLLESTGIKLDIRLSTTQTNESIAGAFLFRMIMMYSGIVLLIICFTVLAIEQLSDSTDFKYRFGVLKKMGVSDNSINNLIAKQMGVWFGLSIVLAGITAAVLTSYFISSYQSELSAYIGMSNLMINIAMVATIIIILLVCYFVSTWVLFKRNLRQ